MAADERGVVEGADQCEEPFFAEPLSRRRSEAARQSKERVELGDVAAERKAPLLGEVAIAVVANARSAIEPEEIRDVAARELLGLGVEERRPNRLRARAHVGIGAAEANPDRRLVELGKTREHRGDGVRVGIEKRERLFVRAGDRDQVGGADGLAEVGQDATDARRMARDRRVLRVGVGQELGLGWKREIGEDHLDVERREHDPPDPVDAEREVFPVEIGEAEPTEERDRAPDDPRQVTPRFLGADAERLELQPLDGTTSARSRRREPERWKKMESVAAGAREQAPKRTLLGEQEPLPDDRARLLDAVAGEDDTAPEVVRITERETTMSHERARASPRRALHSRLRFRARLLRRRFLCRRFLCRRFLRRRFLRCRFLRCLGG